jgi:hypothetical protein
MESKSFHKDLNYKYNKEKRKNLRVPYNLDVLAPFINNESSTRLSAVNGSFMKATNLSEGGISFKGNVPLKVGDFIDFLISIEGNASFKCLCEVKWVGFDDETLLAGCQFLCLTQEQVLIIRGYVNKKLKVNCKGLPGCVLQRRSSIG